VDWRYPPISGRTVFVLVIVPAVFSVALTDQMNVAVHDSLSGITADVADVLL
jgi:hypothetical protein